MKPVQELMRAQKLSLQDALHAYWDKALSPSDKNPFPGAPPDKVRAGLVNEDSYKAENLALEQFVDAHMVPEIQSMAPIPGICEAPMAVEFIGLGWHRDLKKQTVTAIKSGLMVRATDISDVAFTRFLEFLDEESKTCPGVQRVSVRQTEFGEALRNGEIDLTPVASFYGGQFFQNSSPRKKNAMLSDLGAFLGLPALNGRIERRLYMLHPLGEDNPRERVEWRNTIPYTQKELRSPLEKGLGREVVMEVLGKHSYWHQRYTLFKITASVP